VANKLPVVISEILIVVSHDPLAILKLKKMEICKYRRDLIRLAFSISALVDFVGNLNLNIYSIKLDCRLFDKLIEITFKRFSLLIISH